MSDIVGRLRKENSMPPYYGPPKLQEDAAAEIERLRAALAQIAKWRGDSLVTDGRVIQMENIARAVLDDVTARTTDFFA